MARCVLAALSVLFVWLALPTSEARADAFAGYVCTVETAGTASSMSNFITITSAPGCGGSVVTTFRVRPTGDGAGPGTMYYFQMVAMFAAAAGSQARVTGTYTNTIFGRMLDSAVFRGD